MGDYRCSRCPGLSQSVQVSNDFRWISQLTHSRSATTSVFWIDRTNPSKTSDRHQSFDLPLESPMPPTSTKRRWARHPPTEADEPPTHVIRRSTPSGSGIDHAGPAVVTEAALFLLARTCRNPRPCALVSPHLRLGLSFIYKLIEKVKNT